MAVNTFDLNDIKDDNEGAINIDMTKGGTSNVQVDTAPRKINTPKKRISIDDVSKVNPNDYVPKKEEKVPHKDFKEDAFNKLDIAMNRKVQELKDAQDYLIEKSKENEELVEEGLADVSGEYQYLPDKIDTEVEKEIKEVEDKKKPSKKGKKVETEEDEFEGFGDDEFDDDYGFEEEKENEQVELEAPTNVVITPVEEEKVVESEEPEVIEEPDSTEEDIDKVINDTLNEGGIVAKSTPKFEETIKEEVTDTTKSDFSVDGEDFDDLAVDSNDVLTEKQINNIRIQSATELKSQILKNIINTGNKLNITSFSISNKVVEYRNKDKTTKDVVANWPLTYAGRPFVATPLKGPEVALLSELDESMTSRQLISIQMAKIFYEHDANPYKPATVEAWAKTIPYGDIDNIFAALYKATMTGSNYIPYYCSKDSCQYSWITDEYSDINSIISFKNDNCKKRYEEVSKVLLTEDNSLSYESTVNVINDRYAIGIKVPSIYSALYEFGQLSDEFIMKYQSIITIMQYIDYIYEIDVENQKLSPIGWKTFADKNKTFRSKIYTYHKILSSLSDVEFSRIMALIQSIINTKDENQSITYKIPESKCPKCGTLIEEREISPREMVFMRQRLIAIATSPIER